MGEQRQEKDRTMVSETTQNTKESPWLGRSQQYLLGFCCVFLDIIIYENIF